MFLSVRLNCTMLPCKAPPALLPIGPRDPRLYFLLRRLHQTKFLKDITEITTRPEFAFLPLMLALRGLGAVPVGPTDGRTAHLGRGAGGNLSYPPAGLKSDPVLPLLNSRAKKKHEQNL